MTMNNCIFCKIVAGTIPSNKILESKDFFAFLDIKAINPGHCLVIPKKHCENLLDFPKSEETDFMEFTKKVAKAVTSAVGADGFNLGMNNGAAAGQVVFHAHMHIIPRFNGDGLAHWPGSDVSKEELNALQKKILEKIK